MRRRINAHRDFVWILGGDVGVHLEKIAVALFDDVASEALDGIGEIEIDAAAAGTDAAPFVAYFLRPARGDIARREVAEAGVFALEVVIALIFRNLIGTARIARNFRHPDAAV